MISSIPRISRTLGLAVAVGFLPSFASLTIEAQSISVELVGTFDYPRPGFTFVETGQINDEGSYVGSLYHQGATVGFTANTNGFFSKPFSEPDAEGNTAPFGIKNGGGICGTYFSNSPFGYHGFFRQGSNFQTFDAPVQDVLETSIRSVNSANNFVGAYTVAGGANSFAFAQIDGSFIKIPITATTPQANGINSLNQVVGTYSVQSGTTTHGFFREADGTLTMPIDFPGAVTTVPKAINDSGYIVGLWRDDRSLHAFVMQLPDTFITYDLPGASETYFTGINNAGLICGTYSDRRFNSHIFIAQLVVQ